MRHISCDSCGKNLPSDGGDHYIVRMEAAKVEPKDDSLTHEDLDESSECDSVHEMTLMLNGDGEDDFQSQPAPLIRKDFDFCTNCYDRFARDPLGQERASHRRFSAN